MLYSNLSDAAHVDCMFEPSGISEAEVSLPAALPGLVVLHGIGACAVVQAFRTERVKSVCGFFVVLVLDVSGGFRVVTIMASA